MASQESEKGKKPSRPPNIRQTTMERLGYSTETICNRCESPLHDISRCKSPSSWSHKKDRDEDWERYAPEPEDLEPPVGRQALSQKNENEWDLEDRIWNMEERKKRAAAARQFMREQRNMEKLLSDAMNSSLGEKGSQIKHSPIHMEQSRGSQQPVRVKSPAKEDEGWEDEA